MYMVRLTLYSNWEAAYHGNPFEFAIQYRLVKFYWDLDTYLLRQLLRVKSEIWIEDCKLIILSA